MILALLACSSGPDAPLLTVIDGEGSGAWPVGSSVWIAANVRPDSRLVIGWDGADLAEWNGYLTMPGSDRTVTPTLVDNPARWAEIDGALVAQADDARGRVVFFHGARYAKDELRDPAGMTLAGALVRARWTVIGLDSAAALAGAIRASGAWSDAAGWTVAGSQVDVDLGAYDADTAADLRGEIEIMAADHELYDDTAAAVVTFLEPL